MLKETLYKQCSEFVENRFRTINNSIEEVQSALMSETKSTAGDKHETGRAMLQLEREKLGKQLLEIEKLQEVLSKLDTSTSSKTIGFGSIVHTTQANYFIAISAGILKGNSKMYYAISSTTPIGLLLMGKQKGDIITFKEEFTILEVL